MVGIKNNLKQSASSVDLKKNDDMIGLQINAMYQSRPEDPYETYEADPMVWRHISGDTWTNSKIPKGDPMSYVNYAIPRTTTDVQDQVIAKALGKAIRHANRIVKREHIKADRIERVNQFITSVRREVGSAASYMPNSNADLAAWVTHVLSDKSNWHDIGITTIIGHSTINKWLVIVQRQAGSADSQSEEILADLEELERSLVGVNQSLFDAERINKESDVLVYNLCHVFADRKVEDASFE